MLGDQIWVWEDDHWERFHWLVDGFGAEWNGRWWDDRTRTFSDITLEAGKGYYYRHPGNGVASNFQWKAVP